MVIDLKIDWGLVYGLVGEPKGSIIDPDPTNLQAAGQLQLVLLFMLLLLLDLDRDR